MVRRTIPKPKLFHVCCVYRDMRVLTLSSILFVGCSVVVAAGIAGIWTGESICTIKDSPCHDEQVIYRISSPDAAGKLTIQADKVVNGKPEAMGTLDCTFDEKASKLACPMKNGNWEFVVSGTKMTGSLKLSDGRLYRNVSVTKQD